MIISQNKLKYAFVLGHVPALSQAEITRTLEHESINFQPVFYNEQVFIIEIDDELNVNQLQERLGGTIKISRIMYHPPATFRVAMRAGESCINQEIIGRVVQSRLQSKKKKFQFGFSYYGKGQLLDLQRIGLAIKKELKEKGINSRLVVSKEPSLSSVIVQKEKLIEQGVDVVIIQSADEYFIGYTVSVQQFEDYSERDYGRPSRDDKSGLLPPKLAKMMLNISQADFTQTILDPFCGSGTIIQEALMLGYKNIIGSDISPKAVKDSQNNINWLKTKYNLDIAGVKIFQSDATQLSEKIAAESIDCIVTEPYLGPAWLTPNSQFPTPKKSPTPLPAPRLWQAGNSQNLKIIDELSGLYIKAFEEFCKVLKSDGKIVIIFPIINGQRLAILDKIEDRGLRIEELSEEPRGSIVYSRPGQRVAREIFVFIK